MKRKRRTSSEKNYRETSSEEEEASPVKKKAKTTEKKQAPPKKNEDNTRTFSIYGWKLFDTIYILSGPDIPPNTKIAAFDMDSTLIKTKSGRKFAKDVDDWQWQYPNVPKKLQQAHKAGFSIVIITNQKGISTGRTAASDIKNKIEAISKELNIPNIQAFIITADDRWRKPSTAIWNFFIKCCNKDTEVDLAQSYYCGDAAGRPARGEFKKDFSCGDRKFAANVGLKFYTPEMYFLDADDDEFSWGFDPKTLAAAESDKPCGDDVEFAKEGQEMVILVGRPGSGKSSFCQKYFPDYVRVNRDTLGTKAKCLRQTRESLEDGDSVIIDNTNPSPKARGEFISLAQNAGVDVRCFFFDVPLEVAGHMNMFRTRTTGKKKVPLIAYNLYKKHFVMPTKDEGISEINTVKMVPSFADDKTKALFYNFT